MVREAKPLPALDPDRAGSVACASPRICARTHSFGVDLGCPRDRAAGSAPTSLFELRRGLAVALRAEANKASASVAGTSVEFNPLATGERGARWLAVTRVLIRVLLCSSVAMIERSSPCSSVFVRGLSPSSAWTRGSPDWTSSSPSCRAAVPSPRRPRAERGPCAAPRRG
jgi:hypothetical protein